MVKKFLNILGIGLGCLMILGVVVVNVGRPIWESSFVGQVAAANRDCPIPVAGGAGQITSICLEDDYLTYHLSYDKGHHLLNALGEEKFKEGLLLTMICLNGQGDHQGDWLMSKLAEEQCGLKIIVSISGVKQFECKASWQELQEMRHACTKTPHEALHSLIQMMMEAEKLNLPAVVVEGWVVTDCGIEGENIYFTVHLDENLFSLKDVGEHGEYIRPIVTDLLEGGENNPLFELCKVAHFGTTYRVIGSKTKRKCELRTRLGGANPPPSLHAIKW